ncbi:MAG: hypothetical protein AAGU14_05640 [Eubacteriaceae bacterium]
MEYEKYLYDIEQMKADVRAYIADGMNWVRYHNSLAKDNNEKKKDKITNIVNEDILKAWDKIDYFEKAIGKDIFDVIPYLDEEEKQFIIRARELRNSINQNNQTLPKRLNNNKYYFKKTTDKINVAKDELNIATTKEEKYKLQEEIKKLYIEIGWYYLSERLEPYIDQFTPEEQQYINEGRMAKLGSEYAEGAEKARKFLKTSAAFKKVGDRITQVGVDFNKAMTSKGEELGDKVRQAGVKLSPAIINLGEDVVEFADKFEEKGNLLVAKMQFKKWRKNVYNDCLETAPNAPEHLLEQKFKETFNVFCDLINERFPIIQNKTDELTKKFKEENPNNDNNQELEKYLLNNIEEYKEYKYYNEHINYCKMICKYSYEELNN